MENHDEPVMGYLVRLVIIPSDDDLSVQQNSVVPASAHSLAIESPPTYNEEELPCMVVLQRIVTLIAIILVVLFSRQNPPKFRVSSITVSIFKPPASRLTTNVSFSIENPNKMATIFYDEAYLRVLSNNSTISSTPISPFHQFRSAEILLKANIEAPLLSINKSVAEAIDAAKKNGSVVEFTVTVDACVRVQLGSLRLKSGKMRVTCEEVKVKSNTRCA
ncbi:unnamed protein product [Ilex paraguariensis]|uniref:Late embryogenesis abundant protein LEA-2 subgroup domain-containing protein n=1 Tax=Ilex paraguariensis TaxID=185542 RepID=A0ABC8TNY7_9AQUA